MFSLAIPTILPLLSLALALPLEPRDDPKFTINSLSATFPYPGVYGKPTVNSFVNIAVAYPDPSSTSGATLNTTCSVSWPEGTAPGPTAWTPCGDSALQLRLPTEGWTSTTNFEVELWETTTTDGAGLDATQILTSGPSDPNGQMFCIQMGKFNPLTCTLTGPYGSTPRTVVMDATEETSQPN
ncbi:hypothetical protein GGR53DRAFT_330257 [Hypoxylon sp. FL1150]|nr:hypothetical protein GGR53DRAFT_330257 [Hypoxylon sp. FL1150]